MKNLKIVFCTDGIFPHSIGGMQHHSNLLIEYLAKNNKVDLIVIHPHEEKVFAASSNIHEFFVKPINPKKNYLLECYRYSKRVYKIISEQGNCIIYSQGLSVWYNIKRVSDRLIINPHGLEAYQVISLKEKMVAIPFKIIFNYLFNNAAYVISLGGKLTGILNNTITNHITKVIELPNGVNFGTSFSNKHFNTDKINFLFVARFAHNKGIHILLEAIKELNSEGWENKLNFNLGGRGPLFEHFRSNFNYKNIIYLGFISDEQLTELYKKADAFVFPTLFEGMPTVVLEAMSFGVPIIVSDVGATAELVDSTNGYLINKNSVFELKKAIIDFYNSEKSYKEKLSKSSLNKIKNKYEWSIVAKKHIELFKKVADEMLKLKNID